MKKIKVKLSELKAGPIRQEVLPIGFIERVIKYKNILKGVEDVSLEETISNFQRDWDPERELIIWENMAHLYQINTENKQHWTLKEKKKAFEAILLSSLGQEDLQCKVE
ncbi:MAG: hypothetical protein WCI93_02715 [bacterium]